MWSNVYHILNGLEFYEQDPKCIINEEGLSKTYDGSQILKINIFKDNITILISNLDTKNYEINNESNYVVSVKNKNNDVIHISKNKILLSNEEQ